MTTKTLYRLSMLRSLKRIGEDPPTQYTKEQVDAMINDHKKSSTAQLEELKANHVKTLEALKLTEDQKKSLEAASKDKESRQQTEYTLLKQEKEKIDAAYQAERKKLTEERDQATSRYHQYRVQSELKSAAFNAKVHNPDQILEMYGSKAKITDKDEVVISVFKEGKELLLKPDELLTSLQENPGYVNLFQVNVRQGVGGDGTGGSKNTPTLATDRAGVLATVKKMTRN
jgi:hypothetical protein